ncbi:hypothetical protein B0H13DRAFT_2362905 [Mycena leptocephala]|nr:hypothetical protein B0H13DRAFT_2362905 [Mycena leptocephala]
MATTPQLPDAALSILASDLSDNSTAKAVAAILLIAVIAAALLHYLSPMRLTGLLSVSDVHTAEMLSTLELKASVIREGTLRNSLSLDSTLRAFFAGRTFTLLRCIREVHELATHTEHSHPTLCHSPPPRPPLLAYHHIVAVAAPPGSPRAPPPSLHAPPRSPHAPPRSPRAPPRSPRTPPRSAFPPPHRPLLAYHLIVAVAAPPRSPARTSRSPRAPPAHRARLPPPPPPSPLSRPPLTAAPRATPPLPAPALPHVNL